MKPTTHPAGYYFGIPVYVSQYMGEEVYRQVRFPRSKRKRIRRKWARDSRNWAMVPSPNMHYQRDGFGRIVAVFCNSSAYANLTAGIAVLLDTRGTK